MNQSFFPGVLVRSKHRWLDPESSYKRHWLGYGKSNLATNHVGWIANCRAVPTLWRSSIGVVCLPWDRLQQPMQGMTSYMLGRGKEERLQDTKEEPRSINQQ